ncbi:MAG: cysteine hydrolase [Alphaproteobacteria bacterium]|nr:cysteine hydrolase [Alphaproteobacteria bacterium]
MHNSHIDPEVIARVIKRRGKEHVHEDLTPSRTALIVVDMQNAFMPLPVAHAPCDMAPKIVPQINALAQAVRETGGVVVWIQTACTQGDKITWSNAHNIVSHERALQRFAALERGSEGYALYKDMDARPEDLYVEKHRFSAFIQNSSDLDAILREKGIDTVLITGTVTNVCCESTARDAMMLNYKVVMVSDCNAADNDEEHNATLRAIYLTFGDVMDSKMVTDILRRRSNTRAAAE